MALAQERQYAEALAECRALLSREESPDALNALAYICFQTGDAAGAVDAAQRAVTLRPDRAELRLNLARVLAAAHRDDDAVLQLQEAARLNPAWPEPRRTLAELQLDSGSFCAAERTSEEAMKAFPADLGLALLHVEALLYQGRAGAAVEVLRAQRLRHPTSAQLHSTLAYAMFFLEGADPRDVFEAHRAYTRVLTRFHPAPIPPTTRRIEARAPLRVGILSPDLRTHSVAFFAEALLRHHDPARLRLYVYSTHAGDATTQRLRPLADTWRDCNRHNLSAMAGAISEDEIDVLIELSGHTRHHSLELMRCRVALLQATYIGYPGTTGLSQIDLRIVDSITDPPGESDTHASEKLARLDPCFLCFTPSDEAPAVAPSPSIGAGHITFGSFNASRKLNDGLIAAWAGILNAVPGSRLLLKTHGFEEAEFRERVAARFAAAGIAPDRLDLLAPIKGDGGHLAAYARVDIALDSFPYHGTTTTCDALWMGVPVVTLAGRSHASRVGPSLLNAVGLADLVASSVPEYIEKAAALASEPARLARIRESLRATMAASPLCDGAAYCRRFEDLIEREWRSRITN
jgi:protein O-GlcNAc transferase